MLTRKCILHIFLPIVKTFVLLTNLVTTSTIEPEMVAQRPPVQDLLLIFPEILWKPPTLESFLVKIEIWTCNFTKKT